MNKQSELIITEAIQEARKVQEYIWQELSLRDKPYKINADVWSSVFQKRVDCIKEVRVDHPHYKVELRKRILQQAALSICALEILDSLEPMGRPLINVELCDKLNITPEELADTLRRIRACREAGGL